MPGRPRASRHSSRDLDDALAFRIHRTNRLLRTQLGRFLQEAADGLTPEQWFVVTRLAERAPIRQVELAEPVLGDPPNVSRLVDALVARGYVERSPDPVDRRSRLVSLTSGGDALAATLHERAVTERERVFAGFTSEELDRLAALLDRLDGNLRSLLAEEVSAAARPGAP